MRQYDMKDVVGRCDGVGPRHVHFVARTSTGGFIAIMLGKLDISLQECIQAYHDLFRSSFG